MIVNFFDFDSTLINSPLPEVGKKIWHEKTGEVYPYEGWWGKPESLDMDIFDIKPNNSVYNFYSSHKNNSKNILLTSRVPILENQIKNVLEKNNIHLDDFYFKDESKDKGQIILDYAKNSNISIINVFDDRDKEIDSFIKIKKQIEDMNIEFNIFRVNSGNINKINESSIKNEGAIPSYTAIKINQDYYAILEDKLKGILIKNNIVAEDFKVPGDYHMTITQGSLPLGLKMRGDIGREIDIIVDSIGISDKAIAFGVSGYMSKNKRQHITMLYKDKPVDSNLIDKWFKLKNKFEVKGKIEEYFLNDVKEYISKVIKNKILNESFDILNYAGGTAAKKVTKIFDNLKWKLTTEQKHYLDDMTNNHPDFFSKEDIKRASGYLKIPENNLKSVLNSFFKYPELNYEQWIGKSKKEYTAFNNDNSKNSRLTFGNKPFTGKEVVDDYKNFQLKKSNKTFLPDNGKRFDTKTKKEQESERILRRSRGNLIKPNYLKEDSKTKFWLLVHLYSNMSAKKIFEENKEINVDILPEKEDYDFNVSMLKSNKKDSNWIMLENLLNEFNKVFHTHYYVYDRYDLAKSKTNSLRYIIKHDLVEVNKPIWDSDAQSFAYPNSGRYETLRMKAKNQNMPKIEKQDPKELLRKFMAGEWDWKTNETSWLR